MSGIAVSFATACTIAAQAGLPADDAPAVIQALKPAARMGGAPYYDGAAVSRAVAFECGLRQRAELEQEQAAASAAWRAIPGAGSGAMGLTPDAVKFGADYQQARRRYDAATARLGEFNRIFCKRYARELKARREEMRAARMAESAQ